MLDHSLTDYRNAPGGTGPLAATWADKPHRLVYDLCSEIERLRIAHLPENLRQYITLKREAAWLLRSGNTRDCQTALNVATQYYRDLTPDERHQAGTSLVSDHHGRPYQRHPRGVRVGRRLRGRLLQTARPPH
jgi:hypothetical protein